MYNNPQWIVSKKKDVKFSAKSTTSYKINLSFAQNL